MSKIINELLKGKAVVTSGGLITFDSEGVANVDDEELVERLIQLKGYKRAKEDIQPENPEPQEEAKEEDKVEEVPPEEENAQETDESTSEDKEEEAAESKFTEEFLSAKNVPQLKKIAKDNNIDLAGATKKDEIIAIILGSVQ